MQGIPMPGSWWPGTSRCHVNKRHSRMIFCSSLGWIPTTHVISVLRIGFKYKHIITFLQNTSWSASEGSTESILIVRNMEYYIYTRSKACLLISWLLMSPGHQQSWYWLYELGMFTFFFWSGNWTTYDILMLRNDIKCEYAFMIPHTI